MLLCANFDFTFNLCNQTVSIILVAHENREKYGTQPWPLLCCSIFLVGLLLICLFSWVCYPKTKVNKDVVSSNVLKMSYLMRTSKLTTSIVPYCIQFTFVLILFCLDIPYFLLPRGWQFAVGILAYYHKWCILKCVYCLLSTVSGSTATFKIE